MNKGKLLEVVERHGVAMGMGVQAILEDYAEDAVVVCNLAGAGRRLTGHKEIGEFLEELLSDPNALAPLAGDDELLFHEEMGENHVLHAFRKPLTGAWGVETYEIKDDKITFESAYIELKNDSKN